MLNNQVRKYMMKTNNGKPGLSYNGQAYREEQSYCKSNPNKLIINKVGFKILVDNTSGLDRIIDARYEVFGEPVTQAAASWCREQVLNKSLQSCENLITDEEIAKALGMELRDNIQVDCKVISDVVNSAIWDYKSKRYLGG